ncbi:sigma-54-dependent transcriptional regulator [Silvibacterium dinghuense]|uniref:sigma-54-dependent transcriptional regulator n=1 Tax=Silvibacterium dinghuense TaxID=1560006 RepID=UPI0013E91652|nr:sigma 54-interacting transcriptional regulator [Silvibacterium dinghuense]
MTTSTDHPEWTLGFLNGRSAVMQRLFSQMRSTATHLRIATLEGESGTGKTAAARTLHALGPAAGHAFLPCPATQFFEQLPAIIREARDGTLLLTHIEALSSPQQMRLIEFLQWLDHQHARHLPDSAPRQVFFSSSVPVRRLVSSATLRIDLANRLTVIRFLIPPLRERREDIPLLATELAQGFGATQGRIIRGLHPQTLARLLAHRWPDNIRELETVIHAAALSCQGQWIRPIDIPPLGPDPLPGTESATSAANPQATHRPTAGADEDPNLDHAIQRHVHRVLERAEGNKLRAARMLGISRSTLYRLLDAEEAAHEEA